MYYLHEFSAEINDLEEAGNYNLISTHILNLMVRNVDLSPIASKVIKLLAVPYPPCKKVLYSFLTKYSSTIADLSILATNSLLKDFEDPNPFMRNLVIKTACSIPCLSDLALEMVPKALNDSHPYVRSSAATSSSLVLNDTNVIKDNQDIINKLYEMIRDNNASVVISSISALDIILESDGGTVVNSRMVFYLLSRLSDFNEWQFSVISETLKKYIPKNTEEVLKILNILDVKLQDENIHVSSLAAIIALHFANSLKMNISEDILLQIVPQLKSLLCYSNQEILIAVLTLIESLMPDNHVLFQSSYKMFFGCFNDLIITKCKKLKILPYLITHNSSSDIAEEILLNCGSTDSKVSSRAILSFIEVLKRDPNLCRYLSSFVSFMDIRFNNLSEEIFNALTNVDLEQSSVVRDCVFEAVTRQADNLVKLKSKASLLRLISRYGRDISSSPYILEGLLNDETLIENEKLFSMLIMTALKLFLSRPSEMQLLLGCILKRACQSDCLLIRKLAYNYNYLLQDVGMTIRINSE